MQSILTNHIYGDEILKILLSIVCGSILGLEREIRGKSAGFRTLALICFGSTVFTICSYLLGVADNRDRIAANIITGVGFLGAGVIFRNNFSVTGITTAASIWVSAAIGMLIGIGEFALAGISVVLALFILFVMDYIQFRIDYYFQHRDYCITVDNPAHAALICNQMQVFKLKYSNLKLTREDSHIKVEVLVRGDGKQLELFNSWLLEQEGIDSFDW